MKKFLLTLSAVLLLAGIFAIPAQGQFIGYQLPQTVTATPFAANTSCTGSAQTATVQNLGQTAHAAFLLGNLLAHGSMVINGSMDGVNFFPISDTAELGNGIGGVSAFASGYYPIIQVSVTCNSGGNFQVKYAGTAVTPFTPLGSQALTQYARSLSQGDPSNTTTSYSFQPPYGSSGGSLYFTYTGSAGPAGSTLAVNCSSPLISGFVTLPATTIPQTGATLQTFPVNAANCAQVTVSYTSGGASSGSFTLDYVFNYSGQSVSQADPCQSPGVAKSSVAINATSAATTQLVALSGSASIYVCGVSMTIAPSATAADTATLEYGTGSSCGTGTTALTGAFGAGDLTTTAPPLFVDFSGPGTTIKTAKGNALCLVTAGTTVNVQGVLTYVQQ